MRNKNEEIFKDLKTFIRVGHPIENLYSLSCCDILIGPPALMSGGHHCMAKFLFLLFNHLMIPPIKRFHIALFMSIYTSIKYAKYYSQSY